MCNRLHLDGNRLPVTDFEKYISKSHNSSNDLFLKIFQKSQLFKWLVLKKLSRVISFDLSHQEIINMWPWHVFEDQSSIFQSVFQYLLASLSTNLSNSFLFIFLKVFVQTLSLPRKVLCSKTCAIHFLHSLLPLPKE